MRRAFPFIFLTAVACTGAVAWLISGIDQAIKEAWRGTDHRD